MDEIKEKLKNWATESFIVCVHHQILLDRSNQEE
jgi:hypothetical protein